MSQDVVHVARIVPKGPLKALLSFMPSFLIKPVGVEATITRTSTTKRVSDRVSHSLDHAKVERVYHNVVSGSFAVVSQPDRSVWFWWLGGRGRRASLAIPFVEAPEELEKAYRELGIEVEREHLSPRRPYLR